MPDAALTRCAPPHLTARRISTYTILGFAGYGVANVLGVVLAMHWELSLGERLIGFFAPPIAFLAVIAISSALAGQERIVFYQTTVAGIVAVALLGWLTGVRVARLLDLATLCIGVFLVLGRLGCHSVACCHGTLGRGIVYGPAHVAAGFWRRWSGRALWPVQLVEAVASAALTLAGVLGSSEPGRAALIYILGYAALRFALELLRGDGLRPYKLGLSEAQWVALATALACALWRPGIATLAVTGALALAAILLITQRQRRALLLPPHLLELDHTMAATSDGQRRETSLGVAISRHALPDGRIDWILSSPHPSWSEATARRLAHLLWPRFDLVPGRTPGVIHVIAAAM